MNVILEKVSRQSNGRFRRVICQLSGSSSAPMLVIVLSIGYWLLWGYWVIILHDDLFHGDVAWYWRDSLAWKTPFNPVHLPGYPLLISFIRSLSGNHLSALVIMGAISFLSYLVGALAVYKILVLRISQKVAFFASLSFALWPLSGLTYAVYPIADSLAIALLVSGLFFYLTEKELTASLILGFSLITHKALWPFVGLLWLASIFAKRKIVLKNAVFLFLPITFLWIAGSFHYGAPDWMFSKSFIVEAKSRGEWPILDGLLGTFLYKGIIGIVKGLIFMILTGLAAALSYWTFKGIDSETKGYALALSISVLFLCLILNQNTIWAAMRFAKVLIFPLIWLSGATIDKILKRKWIPGAIVMTLFISQFAFAWYMAKIFN